MSKPDQVSKILANFGYGFEFVALAPSVQKKVYQTRQALDAAYRARALDYGSWLAPKCDLHEVYTSACMGCQRCRAAFYAVEDYKDYLRAVGVGDE